jgi:SSS family transporter
MTAGLFLVTRAAAEGIRVFAVALVVRIALGPLLGGMSDLGRDVAAVGVVTLLTLVYTFEGGMRAVVWTDVVQLSLYVAGAVVAIFAIVGALPGGWHQVLAVAVPAGRFRVFDLSFHLTTTYSLWAGVIGGAFLTTASHGTDQLIVQRLLAARNERQSKIALVTSGFAVAMLFTLFLLIGALLFVYYNEFPPATAFTKTDMLFPTFIATRMPHLIAGLLISAILAAAMSNLSAALNSLSSITVVDFYARLFPQAGEDRRVRISRAATLSWAMVLFFLALVSRRGGTVIEMGLSIASVAYGSLLGVFLLGVLTRSASERGAMIGMLCGLGFNVYCWGFTRIPFTWYVVFGSAVTFVIGYAGSRVLVWTRRPEKEVSTS